MDEDAFRAFYDRTSRALWGYLSRTSGDRQVADDLLQECYYRLLKSSVAFESENHRRNYLYRIATNLVRDTKRGNRPLFADGVDVGELEAPHGAPPTPPSAPMSGARWDGSSRASGRSSGSRYAQGSSHSEIADVLGLKTGSVKPLLFRARRKLAGLLGV